MREALLGPSYQYHRHLIEQSKNWSADEIRKYQVKRQGRLLRRYGIAVTQKDDYDQDVRRYTRFGLPILTHTVRTGGTSGQPLSFNADTLFRRQKERAYLFDVWAQVGYSPHDLRVVYRGAKHHHLVTFDRLENAWIISPSATTEDKISDLRHWLRTLPPFYLHVYPSSLYSFIDLIGESLFKVLPVRGVLAGSEGFPLGELEAFEEKFGLKIAHWYGHSEYAVMAYQCRVCLGFHFYPTYGHVELLAAEEVGLSRIIGSSFNRIGTQFVRYDTGDFAMPSTIASCNSYLRVDAIVGRFQEVFVDHAGRSRAVLGHVFGIHGIFWEQIRDLQFFQREIGRLCVRIVMRPDADKQIIEQTLVRSLPMATLEFEYVSAIERSGNGKRRYFVNSSDSLEA